MSEGVIIEPFLHLLMKYQLLYTMPWFHTSPDKMSMRVRVLIEDMLNLDEQFIDCRQHTERMPEGAQFNRYCHSSASLNRALSNLPSQALNHRLE